MRLAVSSLYKNKLSDDEKRLVHTTFKNVDITSHELMAHVSAGYPFCAEHKNGRRKAENFTASDVLAVDVDDGLSLDEALAHPYIKDKCSFLYTTPSHTPDHHRFRLVFELEDTIVNSGDMERALTGLVAKVGGDKACTDACRMFFGNDTASVTLLGNKLSKDDVAELTLFGKELNSAWEATPRDKSGMPESRPTLRSQIIIGLDHLLVTDHGESQRLGDLPKGTRVHCPVHLDYRSSAFVVFSKRGVPGVHCSTCRATFFSKPFSLNFNFDYGADQLRELGVTPWEPDLYNVTGELAGRRTVEAGIYVIDQRYLPTFSSACDVVFVKSPKGSGKTEWLRTVVSNAKTQKQRVMLIGHRTSLIQATANRLGLTPYFYIDVADSGKTRSKQVTSPSRSYAICVDSLSSRLDTQSDRYDLVIIDEIEQVLAHLTSSTLKDNRRTTMSVLKFFLGKAKQIIFLDADLNEVTFSCAPLLIGPRDECLVVINEWSSQRGDIHLYENDRHLTSLLCATVATGKRCFVCCNARGRVNSLAALLREQYPDKRVLAITGQTSQEKDAQDFITGLPMSFLGYDVVLVSPAVGTGVDITFDNNAQLVDAVFGFFSPHVTTHFDIDQQLSRVRHPGAIHVWVSPAESHMETDHTVLRNELLGAPHRRAPAVMQKIDIVGFDDNGKPQYLPIDELYADIYAEVMASQRASKNKLRQNFIDLRRHSGWNVIEVPNEFEAAQHGKELIAHGKDLSRLENVKRISTARLLHASECESLQKRAERDAISHDDLAAVNRFELEHFYLEEATEELVERDDDGRLRRKVRLFDSIHRSEHDVVIRQSFSADAYTADTNYPADRRKLLVSLFSSAGIFSEQGGFDTSHELTKATLGVFVTECKNSETRAKVQRLLDTEVARDVESKPAQQLGRLLSLVGLSLRKSRTQRNGDKKIYWYTVDPDEYKVMTEIMMRRRDEKAYKEWNASRVSLVNDDPEAEAMLAVIREKRPAQIAKVSDCGEDER